MKKLKLRYRIILLSSILMIGTGGAFVLKPGVEVKESGIVCISSIQNFKEVRAQPQPPVIRYSGVPVVSIDYSDGIDVVCSGASYSYHFDQKKLNRWAKDLTIPEAEQVIRDFAQANLEVWILLSDLDIDDRARQTPPVLLDNERIARRQNKDWLVVTTAYFDIHLYDLSFTEGSFITRFNSVDAGPITGNWWE